MTDKKIILITGTSSGFGRLTAEMLARQGHKVFASLRNMAGSNAEASKELRALAKKENLDLRVIELDVTNEDSVNQAVNRVISEAGRIDILVNNAGVVSYGPIEAFPIEQIKDIFEVNLFGALRMNRAVLPRMRKQGEGLLIHLSSGLGRVVFPVMGAYSGSKFALEAIAETYRYELAPYGVDSVVIEPGVYPTNMPGSTGRAADRTRITAYETLASLADQLPKQFVENAKDRDAGEVARAVADLIGMAPDTRPLRTCIGVEAEGAIPLNQTASQIQGGLLSAFGLPELAHLSA